jgi:ArsR family transcriptional regulator
MATSGNSALELESAPESAPAPEIRQGAILRALADPRRFELLERIAAATAPLSCAEAKEVLAISAATLSHHIKELEAAGLVRTERQGKYIFLTLRQEVWEAFQQSLAALGCARKRSV